jgi:hypothetical protein
VTIQFFAQARGVLLWRRASPLPPPASRRRCGAWARYRGFESAAPSSASPVSPHGYEPNTLYRGPAGERPGDHAVPARLPRTCETVVCGSARALRRRPRVSSAPHVRIEPRAPAPQLSAARAYAPNAPSGPGERPGGHAASASNPCTCVEASSALLCSSPPLPRPRPVGSAQVRCARAGFPVNEGGTAREAAFRIEPRAPVSPARRRAGVRFERAVEVERGRSGGYAASARLPCTRKGGPRRRCSCNSLPPVLVSPARRCAVAARAGAAMKVALARNQRGAQVLPTRAARD